MARNYSFNVSLLLCFLLSSLCSELFHVHVVQAAADFASHRLPHQILHSLSHLRLRWGISSSTTPASLRFLSWWAAVALALKGVLVVDLEGRHIIRDGIGRTEAESIGPKLPSLKWSTLSCT